jgi:zinc/manganese transport system substrate-binding protein
MTSTTSVRVWRGFAALIFLIAGGAAFGAAGGAKLINVVAAENFYGNIAGQLGGERVRVTSILSDPNVDPHEYESSVNDAKAVAGADLVIENGGGYDDWMDKLLSGSPSGRRIVLKAYDSAGNKLPDNEHVWYDLDNVQGIAQSVAGALQKLAPADAALFARNLQDFQKSLTKVRQKMADIRARWNGTPIGLTETIFLYQTKPLGLVVLTPIEFQKAIAEGNDPPADTVVAAENQVKGKKIKTLVYNEQTMSPITTKLREEAQSAGIPIVAVTETMPSAMNYQNWMLSQLTALAQALGK